MTQGRNKEELQDITLLGNQNNKYEFDYTPQVLETFDNKHQGRDYFVKFNCRIHFSLPYHWTTRFCYNLYFIYTKYKNGRIKITKIIFI